MSYSSGFRPVLQNRLLIDGEELLGSPPEGARTNDEARRNADKLVRRLIVEERRRTNPSVLPDLEPSEGGNKDGLAVSSGYAALRIAARIRKGGSIWSKIPQLRWGGRN